MVDRGRGRGRGAHEFHEDGRMGVTVLDDGCREDGGGKGARQVIAVTVLDDPR
jgi:hypothetical protein